jgi:flagellar protein FlaG
METVMTIPHTQPIAKTDIATTPKTSEATNIDTNSTIHRDLTSKQVQKNDDIKPEEVTKEFNELSQELNLDIKFAYNEKIDTLYINVTDKNSGRVIRKLPTEEAMKIKESMQDLVGVLFDKKG